MEAIAVKKAIFLILLLPTLLRGKSLQSPVLPITQNFPISQFGAKGDGVSDDSQAFIAAIAAASNAGATVTLADKTYLLTTTLRIRSTKSIAIVGGAHTMLLFAPAHPLENGFLIEDASGVQLKSFGISGSAAGIHCGINVDGSSNIHLDNLLIENINGVGTSTLSAIRLAGNEQIWITRSTFTNIGLGPGKAAAVIWNYYKTRTRHLYIEHNHIFGNSSDTAIALFDTDHVVVDDNVIDGGNNCFKPCVNNGYGILFYRTEVNSKFTADTPESLWPTPIDETITNNQVTNTAGSGIYLQGVHGAIVMKNTITDAGLQMSPSTLPVAGIALNFSNNIKVLSNTIIRSRQVGIALATTKNVLIQANQIHDPSVCGVHLRVAQIGTTIKNNVIDGAPIGLLSERNPVSTIVKGNVLTRVRQSTVGQMR